MVIKIYNNVKIKNFKKLNLYLAKVEQLKKVETLKSNNGK
jgi:hypothetical protein